MKKNLLYFLLLALFTFTPHVKAQITITGPTFVKNSSPYNTWGTWVQDPLDNSGKIWEIPDYGSNQVREYASMADVVSNNVSATYNLPFSFAGTGHIVYGGNLYFNKYNSNNLVKFNLATQTVLLDVPLAGAGFMNTYDYQWGGYSDIDFAVDETGFYVIYSTAANSGNIVISKLDPNTLLPLATHNTSTTKSCGNTFMVQGINYSVAAYWPTSTSLNYQYNTLTSTGSVIAIPFTNGSSYLAGLSYNPTTQLLFAWNNGGLYTYTVTGQTSITTSLSLATNSICAGSPINVTYNANSTFSASNTFTAQLSNSAGSFASGVTNIGTLSSTSASGTINAFIPAITPNGSAYRIRVASDMPISFGTDNGNDLFISNITPTVSAVGINTLVCYGEPVTFTASGASSYSWSNGATTPIAVIIPASSKTHTVTGSNGICTSDATVAISLLPMPNLIGSANSTLCPGSSTNISVSGADTYSWNHGPTSPAISVTPSISTVYTAVGTSTAFPCAAYKSISVFIEICNSLFDAKAEGINFKVYPNPSSGEFYIELNNGSIKQLELMDMTGKVILKQESSKDLININLENYSNGIYYLKIQSNNSVQTMKLIKQ